MKRILLVILWIAVFSAAHAQESEVKKAQQNFDYAQKSLRERDYDAALKSLNDAVLSDPAFQLAFIQLGDIYKLKKNPKSATENYIKAISIQGKTPEPRVYYSLGETELTAGNYNDAKKHFQLFKTNYTGKDQEIPKKADKFIKDCDFSITAIKNPLPYSPTNLGPSINTANREYLPAMTADGQNLIFSRTINGNEDFFISRKQNNQWQPATPLSDKINTKFNEGAQSISPDGKYLFFTGCNRPDGLGSCDLYVSHKSGNDWDTPFNLGPTVNSSYWDSQPAISPDGSTLYFVSNRPGGYGGYDLWKTILDSEGNWGTPQNLGSDINTPYDENTPFVHPDGKTLYFSSNGWPGLGNMDIFYSRKTETGKWSQPVNIGYPINTPNEETGLTVSPDGTLGLFSSILKDGFGDMDIYSFQLPSSAKPSPVTYVKGIIRDAETKDFLEATVQVINLKTKETNFNDYTSKENGEFLAVMPLGSTYAFNASADGYLFYSENFELTNTTASIEKPYTLNIFLEKLKPGTNVILKNIFFDTNKYELLPTSITELNTLLALLQNNKSIAIEIQGHTDNVGKPADNQKLSLQRAKSVYDYLINNKTDPERLTFKGYGETKPIASNDTETGRKQNRRTSFTITHL